MFLFHGRNKLQNRRITEGLRLGGVSGDLWKSLLRDPAQSRDNYTRLPKVMSKWHLNISKDGDINLCG